MGKAMRIPAEPILSYAGPIIACVLWSCEGRVTERAEALDAWPPTTNAPRLPPLCANR